MFSQGLELSLERLEEAQKRVPNEHSNSQTDRLMNEGAIRGLGKFMVALSLICHLKTLTDEGAQPHFSTIGKKDEKKILLKVFR